MDKIIIAGSGTGVGKTLVSAIITEALQGDYWKPVECGEDSDTATLKKLLPLLRKKIHLPAYSLRAHLSPHHAAKLEKIEINPHSIVLPDTKGALIIETVGGVLVPLNGTILSLDLFKTWPATWILVSKNYLGSINHTLLSLEVLKQRNINVKGIIFNGEPNPESEEAILHFSQLSCIARIFPEQKISTTIIKEYAKKWGYLKEIVPASGIRLQNCLQN